MLMVTWFSVTTLDLHLQSKLSNLFRGVTFPLPTIFIMGRRAKNKQGDPETLQGLSEHVSSKRLGKRKAGTGNLPQPAKKSKHKGSLQDDDSLNGVESDESSEGWEGIQDEDSLPAQTRYVTSLRKPSASSLTNSNTIGHCLKTVTIIPQISTRMKTRTKMRLSPHRTSQPGLVHSTPGPLEKPNSTRKNSKMRHRSKRMSLTALRIWTTMKTKSMHLGRKTSFYRRPRSAQKKNGLAAQRCTSFKNECANAYEY